MADFFYMFYIGNSDATRYVASGNTLVTDVNKALMFNTYESAYNTVKNNLSAFCKSCLGDIKIYNTTSRRTKRSQIADFDEGKIGDIISNIIAVKDSVFNELSDLSNELSRCDLMLCDIRHFKENTTNRSILGDYRLIDLERAILKKRRKIKVRKQYLEFAQNIMNKESISDADYKTLEGLRATEYHPRILNELFEGKIPDIDIV